MSRLKSLFASALVVAPLLLPAAPAQAAIAVRACTNDRYGVLNVRNRLGNHGQIIGRLNNGQVFYITGWRGRHYDGYRWYQTTGNGWVRGDYICDVRPARGPGSY